MIDIGLMVRAANPVPDDTPLTDDELSAVLLLAQQRSGDMDVKELTRESESDGNSTRSGLLVAVGAFAAVAIIVAGVALVLNRSSEDAPPVTTPSTTIADAAPTTTIADTAPTTTVAEAAPTTTLANDALGPEEEVFVGDFFEAFNARDEAALVAMASPDAKFTSYVIVDASRELWEQELAWRWAMDEQWTAESCKSEFSAIS